jgi:hypothetical protein
MPFTSRGWSSQKSAICSKVRVVLSISQTAVAFGMRILAMGASEVLKTKNPALRAGLSETGTDWIVLSGA